MLQTPERASERVEVVEQTDEGLPEARLLPSPAEIPVPPKKMDRRFIIAAAIGAAVIAAVAVFVARSGNSDRSEPQGSRAVEAAADMEIETPSGTFAIDDVILGDRYPEGCSDTDPSCNVASPGYKVLALEFIPQGSADVEDIMSDGSEAYVISSNGNRTDSFLYGWSTAEGDTKEGMVGFTPADADQGFTLYWPGNDPVELGR